MPFQDLLVTEIFHSIQGESSQVGIPFVFIRLTGCNLRCTYCDTAYAFKGGTKISIADTLEKVRAYQTPHVLITGGEPLLQRQTPELIRALLKENFRVNIETHGELSLAPLPPQTRIIMDIKTPASQMCRGGFMQNLKFLKPTDEIKFVIASSHDYDWAKALIQSIPLPTQEILFSPAIHAPQQPGHFTGINPTELAEKILSDRLPVRFQLQLHKIIWGNTARGV